jgi:beta-galactosidase
MDVGIGTEGGREIARLPVVEGEYNREESPRRVWDDLSPPNFGYPEAKGQTYQLTSEQYAVNQVSQYVKKLGGGYHSGGANWIFSDSTSGGRVATEVARAGGEVDGVRLPKEAYYVCRAMFRDDPQVHIIGHWTYPANTRKAVYVASNAEEVQLFVNGRSLGRAKPSQKYLFTFADVVWEAGEIKAVAYQRGKPVAQQSKRTAGEAVALRMTPITGPGGLRADGADVLLIDVEAVDANGQRCPTFQQRVDFATEGAGVWRGGYNSGKVKSTNNPYLDLEAGVNRVAVRATRNPGKITVRATSGNLKPAVLTAQSVASGDRLPAIPDVPMPSRPMFTSEVVVQPGRPQQPMSGRFIGALSYSGPTTSVHVEQDVADGKRIYVDSDAKFEALPAALRGFEYAQAANADRTYSAVDLMEVATNTQTIVYLAHDDRLARPAWLVRSYKPAGFSITVSGKPMTVFTPRVREAGSLTLGANTEDAGARDCNMYVVFVGPL